MVKRPTRVLVVDDDVGADLVDLFMHAEVVEVIVLNLADVTRFFDMRSSDKYALMQHTHVASATKGGAVHGLVDDDELLSFLL